MPSHLVRWMATASALVVASGTLAAVGSDTRAQAADPQLSCSGQSLVEKTLKNGASWRMCVTIDPIKGLVLQQVEYKPPTTREYAGYKRVLDSLYLSNLNVPYDTGYAQYDDIPTYGFGNKYLTAQTTTTCPGGETRSVSQSFTYSSQLINRTIPGICLQETATGLSTHSQESPVGGVVIAGQGTALQVSSISKIDWYEYQELVTFGDLGQIDVGLGATGDLAGGDPGSGAFPTGTTRGWPIGGEGYNGSPAGAASHWHNAIWRVDFGIDDRTGAAAQAVEQWDYAQNGNGSQAPLVDGTKTDRGTAFSSTKGTSGVDDETWWRVLNPSSLNSDGYARSYEIVNDSVQDRYLSITSPKVSFTNEDVCEAYAAENAGVVDSCTNEDNVLDFVANDAAPLDDPVAWVNVGFHHIVRGEDQSPMPVHWQRFQLVPRDFFAQSPATPDSRACINGPYRTSGNLTIKDPCNATNTSLPTVSADTGQVAVGTTLTATSGSWNTVRTAWTYSYTWLRDGQPTGATGTSYVVGTADLGHTLSVRVTASPTDNTLILRYPSASAASAGIVVPAPVVVPSPGIVTVTPPPVLRPTSTNATTSRKTYRTSQRAIVTVTVKVSKSKAKPSGSIRVMDGKKTIAKGTLKGGKVSIKLPKLKAGNHKLKVSYLGTTANRSSYKFVTIRSVR